MQKNGEIFKNLIQTLTSEARVLNSKACGVQGRRDDDGGETPQTKVSGMDKISWIIYFLNFKSIHIYMKDVECAETNGKFNFLIFAVFWDIYSRLCTQNWSIFRWLLSTKSIITHKLKIGKFIFHSFQFIAHLQCKFDHFWKKMYCEEF